MSLISSGCQLQYHYKLIVCLIFVLQSYKVKIVRVFWDRKVCTFLQLVSVRPQIYPFFALFVIKIMVLFIDVLQLIIRAYFKVKVAVINVANQIAIKMTEKYDWWFFFSWNMRIFANFRLLPSFCGQVCNCGVLIRFAFFDKKPPKPFFPWFCHVQFWLGLYSSS